MAETIKMIGKYKILGVVAKGGMGIVYRAYHPTLRRQVIIKKLTIQGNKAVLDRFKREAQLLLELQNENIVHMFDYFTEGNSHYIVLEYVDGMALDKLLKKREKLSVQVSLLIIRDTCRALQYAHERGIVHRDIKPGNILMSKAGDVKLADFGISARKNAAGVSTEVTDAGGSDLTQAGVTLGTPAYMPPEQFNDSKNVDARADIYALGIMLYEMLTGFKPYPGNMAPETIMQIQKGKFIAPEKLNTDIPPKISKLVKKMMNSNAKRRFQNVTLVLKKIDRILNHYDMSILRENLRFMIVKTDKYSEPEYKMRHQGVIKATPWFCAAVLVLGAGTYAWHTGLVYEYLLQAWYTPVNISMDLPSSATADSDLPLRAFFFSSEEDTIPEINNTRRVFYKDISGDYSIKTVYLRPGKYRIKVVTGPYLWWESITVGKEAFNEKLDFLSSETRNLKIKTLAVDADTGKNIDSITTYEVLLSKWTPLKDLGERQLKTGNIYKIRANADGYIPEVFSLRIEWYQDSLYISSKLSKKEN
ncbi:MAG: serine/threonine protein kinase [Treponema sp. CETP13]|nr:MAG: serine/threonine protein kinase [Treponema sp. CETP13]